MTSSRCWTLTAALLAACATQPPPQAAACPACVCECPQTTPGSPGSPGSPVAVAGPTSEEIQESIRALSRKMNHGDGKGCLAGLDQLKARAPSTEATLVYLRAQCEMLDGNCQAGKQRLVTHMRVETNTHVDRATATAEAMAAMYCRGGDATDRDRLLGALQELVTAAYSETRTPEQCRATVATIRTLIPKVKPRDVDDHQIANADKSLYATAPGCFARAGDCASAWQLHRELFPQENLKNVDSKVRADVLASTFDSLVPRCKGKR